VQPGHTGTELDGTASAAGCVNVDGLCGLSDMITRVLHQRHDTTPPAEAAISEGQHCCWWQQQDTRNTLTEPLLLYISTTSAAARVQAEGPLRPKKLASPVSATAAAAVNICSLATCDTAGAIQPSAKAGADESTAPPASPYPPAPAPVPDCMFPSKQKPGSHWQLYPCHHFCHSKDLAA
jgi:hypothetical protein